MSAKCPACRKTARDITMVARPDKARVYVCDGCGEGFTRGPERMTVANALDANFEPKEVLNIICALNMQHDGEFGAVRDAMNLALDARRFA